MPYKRKNGKPANWYLIFAECKVCKKKFYRDRSNYRRGGTPVCSQPCKNKYMEAPDGKKRNKRGNVIKNGEIMIKHANHPNNRKGWILEHRVVMEKKIKRFLKKTELVHHIDMIKNNNGINNLSLINSIKEHNLCHASLNECVAGLIKNNHIIYNDKTKRYEINNETYNKQTESE